MKNTQTDNLINPSIATLLEHVENKYLLSLLIARRSRELFEGKAPLTEKEFISNVTTAVNEIAEGKVTYTKPERTE